MQLFGADQINYQGTCPCHAVSFVLSLPSLISGYQLRACDCEFCISRQIVYLSDPQGSLQLSCKVPLVPLKQGSEQAEFLSCPICASVIAASYLFAEGRKGAFNASLLSELVELPQALSASPKLLSSNVKRERWQKLWFPVRLDIG